MSGGGGGNALAALGGRAVVGGVGVDCQSTNQPTNQSIVDAKMFQKRTTLDIEISSL